MRKQLEAIKEECLGYDKSELLFICLAMLCGFFISAEYSVTKPSLTSIFLSVYTVKAYPYLWVVMVPINLLVLTVYNRYLPKIGCFKMAVATVLITIGINEVGLYYLNNVKSVAFILLLWKEISILLMFQHLWSVIHTKINKKKAKYLYGLIFGVGGFGSILGSFIPIMLAVKIGSDALLHFTTLILLLFLICFYLMLRIAGFASGAIGDAQIKKLNGSLSEGFQLIRSSQTLKYILLIVIFMQVTSTLVEYQFSAHFEKTIPNVDLRTKYFGSIRGIINTANLTLQFLGSFILIQCLGLKRSHVTLPMVFLISIIGCLIYPTFRMLTFAYTTIKSCEYSVFNITKEMLYVPLKFEEKVKAKAVIDVFIYRTARVFATGFILSIQIFMPLCMQSSMLSWVPLFIITIWIFSSCFMLKKDSEIKITTQPTI